MAFRVPPRGTSGASARLRTALMKWSTSVTVVTFAPPFIREDDVDPRSSGGDQVGGRQRRHLRIRLRLAAVRGGRTDPVRAGGGRAHPLPPLMNSTSVVRGDLRRGAG